MEQTHNFSFTKKERLCSKRLIENLFDGKGKSLSHFPIRIVYKTIPRESAVAQVSILISVSKRRFKHSVKRNRVKRQIREAYRKNKHLLYDIMSKQPDNGLLIGFLWLSDSLHPTNEIELHVQRLLMRIVEQMNNNQTQLL